MLCSLPLPATFRPAFFYHDEFPLLYLAPGKPASVPLPMTWDGATLLDVLTTAPQADAARTADGCALVIVPPVVLPTVAVPGTAPDGQRKAAPHLRRLLVTPLMLAARMILRRPYIRRLALQLLKRSPMLYRRAYAMMMTTGSVAAPVQPAPDHVAALSPRANAILRSLRTLDCSAPRPHGGKPRLAFVTPLPPERTGVASYAVELLIELSAHADIELVVAQDTTTLPPALAGLPLRSCAWFAEHGAGYDQVLYQIGNSPYHSHMFALLERHPGVVVLHDFFIGGVLAQAQMSGAAPQAWAEALFLSHGYSAVRTAETPAGRVQAHKDWPCSLPVLANATRVIVHSRHARQLAADWFGERAARHIDVIPHPRTPPASVDRAAARAMLGIAPDCFLVCSFGFIAPHKLTHELLRAWIGSTLHADRACTLVLVGANHDSPYGVEVEALIRGAGAGARIRIAGWTDEAVYRQYLQAADVGVQLRSEAKGESSGAVLDCLNYGLSTIVNANGSMAEFPADTVWRLPDIVDVAELSTALETLRADPARRSALRARAVALLDAAFRPAACAQLYLATLAHARTETATRDAAWCTALAHDGAGHQRPDAALPALAAALAANEHGIRRQLLVDVSDWAGPGATPDALAAGELRELLGQVRPDLRIEPVYLEHTGGAPRYRQARNAVGRLLGLGWPAQAEPVVDMHAGDIYYARAASPAVAAARDAGLLAAWRARGVTVTLAVHTAADAAAAHGMEADRLLCGSAALAQALAAPPASVAATAADAIGRPSKRL